MQPHIRCEPGDISPYVLLPGDPARARRIGEEFLVGGRLVAQNREFSTYQGDYRGVPVTVTSTGIGAPSTAIAVEELINLGARVLIRVGTCGGALKPDIAAGSLIIPLAAVREEGTTREYLPPEFPAVADYGVVRSLEAAAVAAGYRHFIGVNRTHDAYYGQAQNLRRWGSPYQDPRMSGWAYPLLSSEMETAPLLLIALMRGVRAGAVLAVNADPEPLAAIVRGDFRFETPVTESPSPEAARSVERAVLTALGAILHLVAAGDQATDLSAQ